MQSAAVLAVSAAVLLLVAGTPQGAAAQTSSYGGNWAADYGYGMACTGTVEECIIGGGASVRRELRSGSYISYGAMQRDRTPCSIRGAPYGNCSPGAVANPYNRGCSAIARCRG